MQVVIVQPPDPPGVNPAVWSPPWDILSLLTFLRERTGHLTHFVDGRLLVDFGHELTRAVQSLPAPRLVAVHASDVNLGEVMAVVETLHRALPDTPVALFGPWPSSQPRAAQQLPHVRFVLAGDPEPILRSLLDFLHVPNRLRQIPGLVTREADAGAPAWLPSLNSLPVPAWQGIDWAAYRSARDGTTRAELRVSRGVSGLPADRACAGKGQPLRFWPWDRLAATLEKSAHHGIVSVELVDPPGVWTPDRLQAWCRALIRQRNTHAWSFTALPRFFSEQELITLADAGCRRIHLVVPSCDPAVLARYECLDDPRKLRRVLEAFAAQEIRTDLRLWVGGPEESAGEARRASRWIRLAGYPSVQLHPFPLSFDSPVFAAGATPPGTPSLESWLDWSREPWLRERPVLFWGGAEGAKRAAQTCEEVQAKVTRNPWRRLRRRWDLWRGRSVADDVEQHTAALFQRPAAASADDRVE